MLRLAIALAALLSTAAAWGQVSGSVALLSDYRFRGVSLSDGRPSAQFAVAFDGSTGWYVGTQVSSVRLDNHARLQLTTYFGRARPLRDDLDWDAGLIYETVAGASGYAYPEAYLGLASERFSARLYYARRYFGQNAPALYVALDRNWPLSDHLRLLGHVGLLRRNGPDEYASSHYRADARAGLGMSWRTWHLQVFWAAFRGSDAPYPFGYDPGHELRRQTWGLSCSRTW